MVPVFPFTSTVSRGCRSRHPRSCPVFAVTLTVLAMMPGHLQPCPEIVPALFHGREVVAKMPKLPPVMVPFPELVTATSPKATDRNTIRAVAKSCRHCSPVTKVLARMPNAHQ